MSPVLQYLSNGKCQVLKLSRPMQLHVITGRLWVTMPNDAVDHFIEPGCPLALDAKQVTLQADSPLATTFALEEDEKCEVRRYAGFCAQRLPAA